MTKRFIILALIVGALLALVVYSKWHPEPPRVSGFIEADEIRLGSRVGGRVSIVHVQEGQEVAAGTVLVELEPFDLLEREKEVELSLVAREAEYQAISCRVSRGRKSTGESQTRSVAGPT